MIDPKDILLHTGMTYQPIPFPEYKDIEAQREDCEERYQVIKKNYSTFKDKSLLDVCCSNGYFCFRFLQDGGKRAVGVEERKEIVLFNHRLARDKALNFVCVTAIPFIAIEQKFNIGIYLDTHYHKGTEGYPDELKANAKVVFTSCACNGAEAQGANVNYGRLLKKIFRNVEPIYKGFAGRVIYKFY